MPLPHKWLFFAIYASNVYCDRCILWKNLKCIHDSYKGHWLMGGDFNEILHATEKFGCNGLCISHSNTFLNCINYCGLSDLGFKGSKFTRTNKRSKGHTILERLDRLFDNYDWINLFPNAIVINLPRTHSDHCPIQPFLTVFTHPTTKIFRFETMWASHPDVRTMISIIWKENNDHLHAISCFTKTIQQWNTNTFGNLFKNKSSLIARLAGIQSSCHHPTSSFLQNLEHELTHEYNHILKLEEEFWALKSRITWLNEGDANTKYFHLSTLQRCRKNRITALQRVIGAMICLQFTILFGNISLHYSLLNQSLPTTPSLEPITIFFHLKLAAIIINP